MAKRRRLPAELQPDEMDLSREAALTEPRNCAHCGASAHMLTRLGTAFPYRVTCVAKACAIATPWCKLEVSALWIWNRRPNKPLY